MSFSSIVSKKKKPYEIPIFRTFLAKLLIFACYISLKIAYLELSHDNDVRVPLRHTHDVGTYFSIYGKKRPLPIIWY